MWVMRGAMFLSALLLMIFVGKSRLGDDRGFQHLLDDNHGAIRLHYVAPTPERCCFVLVAAP